MKYDTLTENQLKSVIEKQKALIGRTGHEPTWELFSRTFGWYMISKNMSPENQEKYKKLWENS